MQTTLPRIWTQIADSIAYNDNSYAEHAAQHSYVVCMCVYLLGLFNK